MTPVWNIAQGHIEEQTCHHNFHPCVCTFVWRCTCKYRSCRGQGAAWMLVFWPFAWDKSLINLDSHYIGQASWPSSFLGTSWVVLPCRGYRLLHLAIFVNLEDVNSGPHTCKVNHLHSPWLRAWGPHGCSLRALLCNSFWLFMSCFYPQSDSSLGLFKKFSSFPYFIRKIYSVCTQHYGKQNKEGTWPLPVQAPFHREKQTRKKRGEATVLHARCNGIM